MKILHCLWDDKFMDGTIRVYESDKRQLNEFVLITENPEGYSFKYIKSPLAKVISLNQFVTQVNNYDVIVLHSFACLDNKTISKIPRNIKVVWYSWGFDIYSGHYPIVPLDLYYRETKIFVDSQKTNIGIKNKLFELKERFTLEKALERVDYFSGVFPYEFGLIKKYHSRFKARLVDFYYGDVNFFIKDTISNDVEHGKSSVIIGNSADPRNNHHDALTILSKIKLPKESNIIIPLSYAGSSEYIQWVKKYAETLFPGRVKALLNYLPLQEYLDLTSHCKVAIFYHERQQASDNIFMQMMYGAKVYMSETSLAYQYLKEEGFVVFSLQSEFNTLFDDISDDIVMKNRRLLCEKYSEHTIRERVLNINQQIESDFKVGKCV